MMEMLNIIDNKINTQSNDKMYNDLITQVDQSDSRILSDPMGTRSKFYVI
jgi:hypothetical protein